MTRLATPAILECPDCSLPLHQKQFASFNDFGVTYWTDGYTSNFMLPESGRLGSCPRCYGAFWVEDIRKLGILPKAPVSLRWGWIRRCLARCSSNWNQIAAEEFAWHSTPDDWHFARRLEALSPAKLFHGLFNGLATTIERETYLRTRLWWVGNHDQRGITAHNPMSAQQREDNIEALLQLVRMPSVAGANAIIEGELLRQLGRADEALAVLEASGNNSSMADYILRLAREGKRGVGAMARSC